VVVRSLRHPREEGTDGVATAFRKGSKLARSPAPSSTQVDELIADTEEAKETPKRTRDPASPANSPRTTPAKRSKASHEATCLKDLLELGKLLQEVSTKMMDKDGASHNCRHEGDVRAHEGASHEHPRGEQRGRQGRQYQGEWAGCCNCVLEMLSKLAERRQSPADNACLEERCCSATGALAKDKPADCGWRTRSSTAKAPRSTRKNPPKGPQEEDATHAGASKTVSPAIPVAEWEVVKKKTRATCRARPDAFVVQAGNHTARYKPW